jgi:glycosyltransferase involved in cell wall biosynthesis
MPPSGRREAIPVTTPETPTGGQRQVLLAVEQLRRAVPGGIGRYTTGLLGGLVAMKAGGERLPAVVLYASRPPPGSSRGPSTTNDPLARYGLPVITSVLPGPLLTRAWDRGLVDAPGHPDLIHAVSLAAPAARHAPLVVTVHDLAWRHVPDAYPSRGRRWHEDAFGRARRRAKRFVVPSESVGRQLSAAGVVDDAIVVIAHGSDHLPPADEASVTALLARHGVEGDFLLSVGTLEPRKNLTRLVAAYEQARPRLPSPWPLVVVGPTGWGDSVSTVSPGPATPGVIAVGPVDDGTLAALYGRARLLAYVPLTEGFGFPPVEAMRAGLPVVSSPLPSIGDGAALVVDPERVDAMAAALLEAATDEQRRMELVAAGRTWTEHQTWVASARAHVALWESMT